MVKGSFKCPRCDRTFSMAAHLARHVNSIHRSKAGKPAVTARTRKRAAKRSVRRVARRTGTRAVAVGGSADLVSKMQTYHGTLVARRESLDAEISALTNAIDALGAMGVRRRRAGRPRGRSAAKGRPVLSAGRPVGRPPGRGVRAGSLKEFIVKTLGQRSTPMSPKQIAAAVVRTGYKSKAKDLTKAVSNTLPQLKKVKKIGFGKYRL